MMHQKHGPRRLFETLLDYDGGRRHRSLCALSLLVLLLIMPLAYARACDSSWIPGLNDVADFDDVVLFLIETDGSTVPGPGALVVTAPARCGVVFPSVYGRSQPSRTEGSRGPPRSSFAAYASAPHLACATRLVGIAFPIASDAVRRLDTLKRIGPCHRRVLTSALEELPDRYRAVIIL